MNGRLDVLEPKARAGEARIEARLSLPGTDDASVFFSVAEEQAGRLLRSADPFVIGALHAATAQGHGLHVTGAPLSPSLAANLSELQLAWRRLHATPVVEITADQMVERDPPPGASLIPFSGGIDSAYTLRQHATGAARAPAPMPVAALIVQGFDVPLDDETGFAGAVARARHMAQSLGVELVVARTNVRALNRPWPRFHGSAVAATLTALAARSAVGLIASGATYDRLDVTSGSNPVTDHLHSSRALAIRHDGAGATRAEKIKALSEWPEAMSSLRVCWAGPDNARNCGACRKCVTVALTCRVLGIEPGFFDQPIAERVVMRHARVVPGSQAAAAYRELVLGEARRRGVRAPWLRVMSRSQRRYHARAAWAELRRGRQGPGSGRRGTRRLLRRAWRRLRRR